jgi:transitional endoplasmic reticulum ATPase
MAIELQKDLISAVTYDDVMLADELLTKGANPNIRNHYGEPLLHMAVANNSRKMVDLLIKYKASLQARNRAGESALAPAVKAGNMEVVTALLDAGALPNQSGKRNNRLLEMALEYDYTDMASLFIEKGADINSRDERGETLLFNAVEAGDLHCVEYLLSKSADVNIECGHFHEETPLHKAVRTNNVKMVKLLLTAKPQLDKKNDDDETPYDIAVEKKNKDIIELFESIGAVKGKRRRRDAEFKPEKITGADFNSVIGLENVKESLYRDIIYPLQHPELAADFKIAVGGGMILFGPPGCGKTFIVKALAGQIGTNIIEVRASDIYDAYVGTEGKSLSRLFKQARENTPCIIFIDEIELLGSSRGIVRGDQTWMREALTQFLTELDGLTSDNKGILIIGATNAPWMIDSALKRHGRLGKLLYVPHPNEQMRVELFRMYLKEVPLEGEVDYLTLAKATGPCSSAYVKAVCEESVKLAWQRTVNQQQKSNVSMEDILTCIKKERSNLSEWYDHARRMVTKESDKNLYPELNIAIGEANEKDATSMYR